MSSARDNILARLRANRAEAAPPLPDFDVVESRGWSDDEKLDRLQKAMLSVRTEFLDARDQDWVARVQAWLETEKVPALMYAPETELGRKLKAGWPEAGPPLVPYDRALAEWKHELFAFEGAGITGTEGGIALTGTLILRPGPAEPRTLSLVPPIHIALLDCKTLHDTMAEARKAQGWEADMPTNLLFVSGPSKTADIEQILAYGVHGPKRLLVVLI